MNIQILQILDRRMQMLETWENIIALQKHLKVSQKNPQNGCYTSVDLTFGDESLRGG